MGNDRGRLQVEGVMPRKGKAAKGEDEASHLSCTAWLPKPLTQGLVCTEIPCFCSRQFLLYLYRVKNKSVQNFVHPGGVCYSQKSLYRHDHDVHISATVFLGCFKLRILRENRKNEYYEFLIYVSMCIMMDKSVS